VTQQRVEKIGRPTGMDDQNIFAFTVTGFEKDFDFQAMVREDMALLRQMPGIVDAAPIRQVPLSGSGSSTGFFSLPGQKGEQSPANYYSTDEHGIETLGTRLSAGATFEAGMIEFRNEDKQGMPPVAIISQGLATALFPKQNALARPSTTTRANHSASSGHRTSTVRGWAGTKWIA
jgi:putative ABC transport system permease protein